jgi:hypothetical protein
MNDRQSLLEYLPHEAAELVAYKPMAAKEIVGKLKSGSIVVWIDDKNDGPLTKEYLEDHFLTFTGSFEDANCLCERLSEMERTLYGVALTRYRFSSHVGEEVFSEDITEEQAAEIRTRMEDHVPEPPHHE